MKNSQGKNGRNRAGKSAVSEPPSQWRSHLNSYRDHVWLVFENDEELDKAIDLLWADELYDLPHSTPDGKSLIIPAAALDCFTRSGLKFKAEKLSSMGEFSPEEIAAMRRS